MRSLRETGTIKRIRLGDLLPDALNRTLSEAKVERIAREFDFGKWKPPVVRKTADGYVLIDGHHRVAGACRAGLSDQLVICYVHSDPMADSRVGEMYLGINDTLAATPTQKFLQRIRAGEVVPIRVREIIESAGYDGISPTPRDGWVHTPTACEKVYNGGVLKKRQESPEALLFALVVLAGCWGRTSGAVKKSLIEGFGLFYHRHPTVRVADLVTIVKRNFESPDELVKRADTHRQATKCPIYVGVARELVFSYNRGRRSHTRLPEDLT
jgi:hypothetical protein